MRAGAVDVLDVVNVVGGVAQLRQHLALLGGKVVAVDEGVALRVVGRVDIDQLDLAEVAVAQQAQRVQVVAAHQEVAGAVPVFAVIKQGAEDFLHRQKGAVVGLALADPAQLVAVFFHLNPRRVGRVNGELKGRCVDADAPLRIGLHGLRKMLAQQFQLELVGRRGVQDGCWHKGLVTTVLIAICARLVCARGLFGLKFTDFCGVRLVQAMACSPFFWITVSRRSAGPPGFLTPRSQSEIRFFETFR